MLISPEILQINIKKINTKVIDKLKKNIIKKVNEPLESWSNEKIQGGE